MAAMTPRGGRALPALFLLATGLNLYSASSTTAPTPSNIVTSGRTESDDQAATVTGSMSVSTMSIGVATTSLSLDVSLRVTKHDTVAVSKVIAPAVALLTTIPPSKSLEATLSTASLSQPNTGLQSTEHMSASVTSVVSLTKNTIPHSETPATTSSPVVHAESTIVTSTNSANLSTSDITHLPSMETSATRSKNLPTEEAISGKAPVMSTLPGPTERHTFSEITLANKPTLQTARIDSTALSSGTSGITMQDVQHALSSGSIAAITITVIAVVLLVFGIAAFLKIRHSSYGRLLDDHDYGSWGNYNNPLYDDS